MVVVDSAAPAVTLSRAASTSQRPPPPAKRPPPPAKRPPPAGKSSSARSPPPGSRVGVKSVAPPPPWVTPAGEAPAWHLSALSRLTSTPCPHQVLGERAGLSRAPALCRAGCIKELSGFEQCGGSSGECMGLDGRTNRCRDNIWSDRCCPQGYKCNRL